MQFFSKKVNSLLIDLEKSGEKYWNVPREVGQMLYVLCRALNAERVLEIGTSNGYSAIWIAQALSDLKESRGGDRTLLTVESHKERFELAKKNFVLSELEAFVTQIFGHAPEIFLHDQNILKGQFDLMFFDATKKQHIEFLKQGLPLLKSGGLVIVDNILSHWGEMEVFVEEADSNPLLTGEILKIGDGLYVGCKA